MAIRTRRRLAGLAVVSFVVIGFLSLWLWHFGLSDIPVRLSMAKGGPRPKVVLRQGTIVGIEAKTEAPQILEEFLGIPFGQSTGGENRFKPPLPVKDSTRIFDASKYGDICPAGPKLLLSQSEDCLNLNIYRQKSNFTSQKLPVLVHIYGGSFNFGFGASRQISNLVSWSEEPFIGISFNYRVNAFGFLPSRLTAREGLLNVGLKDQALLLEWVHENIAAFGGNPNDVTLMGNSAGAHSIGHHLMRITGKPALFHKVIIESGGATARAVYTPTNPLHQEQFDKLLIKLGCEDIPEEQVISALRKKSTKDISKAAFELFIEYNPSVRWPFQPVIDGENGFISVRPIDALRTGKFNKVPILTGFNTNEGSMFTPKNLSTAEDFTNFFHTLLPGLSELDLRQLNKVYPDPLANPSSKFLDTRPSMYGVGPQFKRAEQAYAHFAYIAPTRQTADFAAKLDVPVYLYHFAVNSSIKDGCNHGDHAGFATYNPDIRMKSETFEEISGLMHAYWTSFITTGDPNRVKGRYPDRPQWPAYVSVGKKIVFGDGNDEKAGGGHKGTVVKIDDDTWSAEENKYWWARTELFEL